MIEQALKVILGLFLSFLASTVIIRYGIPRLKPKDGDSAKGGLPESSAGTPIFDVKSTGFWIGLCETLLIFAFVYATEFGGLAIIIGAKEFVRKEDIKSNPNYFLLGTLINVTIAFVAALIVWR